MSKAHKGWIVTNYGCPVYPTLSTLRRVSISRWLQGRNSDEWERWRKRGAVKCERVTFHVASD